MKELIFVLLICFAGTVIGLLIWNFILQGG